MSKGCVATSNLVYYIGEKSCVSADAEPLGSMLEGLPTLELSNNRATNNIV